MKLSQEKLGATRNAASANIIALASGLKSARGLTAAAAMALLTACGLPSDDDLFSDGTGGTGGTGSQGSGEPVKCQEASECPPVANPECQTAVCNDKMCDVDNTQQGTELSVQTDGDCKLEVCDGDGGVESVDDDGDVPADDNNQCTDEVCTNGVPSHPALPEGTVCSQNGGLECNSTGTCHCNPSAPDTITLLNTGNNVGKQIEMVQFENGGAVINQAGTTQDAVPSESLPACMENVQAGSSPAIIAKCAPNCLVDVTHTTQFTTPAGATFHCYDGNAEFADPNNPTQAELAALFGDGPQGSLAYAGQNPWVLGAACGSEQFAYYKLFSE